MSNTTQHVSHHSFTYNSETYSSLKMKMYWVEPIKTAIYKKICEEAKLLMMYKNILIQRNLPAVHSFGQVHKMLTITVNPLVISTDNI